MQNCHDLVQELVKRTKNCHQHGGPQPKFHLHVINEEVANNTNNLKDIFVTNVFEIALTFYRNLDIGFTTKCEMQRPMRHVTFLNLKKLDIARYVKFISSKHVMKNNNVFSFLEA
jgi:hypothetical protein